jgi:membrane-associated phospholipid phosphatase
MMSTDTSANVIRDGVTPQQRARPLATTVALGWLSVYLVATAATLAMRGGHGWLVALHVGLVAPCLAAIMSPARPLASFGDLAPLAIGPLLYMEIPQLIAVVGTGFHDAAVSGWEHSLFGTQPSRVLAGALPYGWLSELLHAGYLSYYFVIFVPPLILYARRERRGFSETVLALTIVYTICWSIYVLFPVEGPRYLWPAPAHVPDGFFRRVAVSLLAAGSSRGAAFPSSHMAVSVVQTGMALYWQPRVGAVLVVLSALIGVGAVYGGFHYGIDMVCGALLGACIVGAVLSTRLRTRPSSPSTSGV